MAAGREFLYHECAMRGAGGMSPIKAARTFREYAAVCITISTRLLPTSDRLALIDMAQAWRALAKQAEKNPELYRPELPEEPIAQDE